MSRRRNISLPPELDDKLDQPHLNASGLVQDLLRAYFAYGDVDRAAEYTDEMRNQDKSARKREACEALATIERSDNARLDIHNPAVLKHGSDLEMPLEEVVAMVRNYVETGEVA